MANERNKGMKTTDIMQTCSATDRKGGMLYPTMLIAAIAVIILSVLGIVTMMGYMPGALSRNGPDAKSEPAAKNEATTAPAAKPAKPRIALLAAAVALELDGSNKVVAERTLHDIRQKIGAYSE